MCRASIGCLRRRKHGGCDSSTTRGTEWKLSARKSSKLPLGSLGTGSSHSIHSFLTSITGSEDGSFQSRRFMWIAYSRLLEAKTNGFVWLQNPPWQILTFSDAGEVTGMQGIVINILDELALKLNFRWVLTMRDQKRRIKLTDFGFRSYYVRNIERIANRTAYSFFDDYNVTVSKLFPNRVLETVSFYISFPDERWDQANVEHSGRCARVDVREKGSCLAPLISCRSSELY